MYFDVICFDGNSIRYLDQTRLPAETIYREARTTEELVDALRRLAIRGAPLIGIAAACGAALAARINAHLPPGEFRIRTLAACDLIASARPTAVNLFWALKRCRDLILREETPELCAASLASLAAEIHADDARRCEAIGRFGAGLVPDGAGVITHCNTGALATGGIGTALGIIVTAHVSGKRVHVFVDETRPLLQGARLTMWELMQHGIPATLITDGTAATVMRQGKITLAITGADRIARNGDTANKIGTYALAVAARHHGIPFYVAAPVSTIDFEIPSGADIPIEERPAEEVSKFAGVRTAPENAQVYAPAFDVTPAALITGIVTEIGVIAPPFEKNIGILRNINVGE